MHLSDCLPKSWLLIAVLTLLAEGSAAGQSGEDGRTAQRRLQDAREQLDRQLSLPGLTEGDRASAIVELSRTLADMAEISDPSRAQALWNEARRATDDFLSKFPRSAHAPLVRLQAALVEVSRGESLRREGEVSAAPEKILDDARGILRRAIAELKSLDVALAGSLSERRSPAAGAAPLSAAQLSSLETHARFQLARALKNQALSYAADSPDRINSALQAAEALARIGELQPSDTLAWQVMLDAACCDRLAGRHDAARSKLRQISTNHPPASVAERALAEQIELHLAAGDLPRAAKMAERASNSAAPQLQLARLEALLSATHSASHRGDQSQAAKWQQAAAEVVGQITDSHKGYYSRRAATMLARSTVDLTASAKTDSLLVVADDLYRAGRTAEALAAYDRARQSAASRGDGQTAFLAGMRAATIQHDRKDFEQALSRFRSLALGMPSHPRAPESHLMAAFDQAQLLRQEKSLDTTAYVELLKEHVANWPKSPTSAQAGIWLGGVAESQKAWTDAISAYQRAAEAAGDSPRAAEAIIAIVRCYKRRLSTMPSGSGRQQVADEAIARFERIFRQSDGKILIRLGPAAREAVRGACALWLSEIPDGYMKVSELSPAAARNAVGATQSWKDSMAVLAAAALSREGLVSQAATSLDHVRSAELEDVLLAVDQLTQALETATLDRRRPLYELQLRVVALLPPATRLPDAADVRISLVRAEALEQTGKAAEAISVLGELVGRYPKSGLMREQLAAALGRQTDPQSRKMALEAWLELARKTKPGSDRWLRACYEVAETQLTLGRNAHAQRTIKLTRAACPGLGGPEMKARYLALLKRTQK